MQPLVAFLDSYLSLQSSTTQVKPPSMYAGDCIIVKHGEGELKQGKNTKQKGLWINNIFSGSRNPNTPIITENTSTIATSPPNNSSYLPIITERSDGRTTTLRPHAMRPAIRSLSPTRGVAVASTSSAAATDSYDIGFASPPLSPTLSPRSEYTTVFMQDPVSTLQGDQLASTKILLQQHQQGVGNPPGSPKHQQRSLFDTIFVDEIRIFILSFLDIVSLCRAAQVSTEWRRLTNDPALWANIYLRKWGHLDEKLDNNQRMDWKEIATGRYLIERNWIHGHCHRNTLRGHSGWVTGVDFRANKLVSSSYDGTIRVWNTQTGNMLHTLTSSDRPAEMSPLWCIQLAPNNRIFAGSSDAKVREWDMISGSVVRQYEGHAGGVKCLQFGEANTLISGSDDKTIKIFDARSPTPAHSIPMIGPVSGLKWHGEVAVTVSKRENQAFLYDLRTLNCMHIFRGHTKPVYAIDFETGSKPRLFTGSRDRSLICWDMQSGEIIKQLHGHSYTVMSVQCRSNKIVSASADTTIKIWDAQSFQCIQTLNGHTEVVMSAKFDEDKIVSGSADSTVIVWDFLRGDSLAKTRI